MDAVEHRKSFARQDDVVAVDFGQPMHLDHAAAAPWIDMPFGGDDAPTVRSALADQEFEIAEQLQRELCPAFAGRDGIPDVREAWRGAVPRFRRSISRQIGRCDSRRSTGPRSR
jgi:hypothetical protein